MPKMHKNAIKARFIIAAPKSSIKLLDKTITSSFRLFLDKYKHIMKSVGFLQVLILFWLVQNNKPVIDAIMGLINKRKKLLS